ncbi:hypothetical protein OTK49_00400 [Vibrio coralliirubri]|uniref:hypothetical protein n=1 Tax=Vibrio coralliirubri TaxID=1516159 RepID=UPI00228347EA|nr:hypothetical protein [Vibrio coralliirubri]MCY9861001.1 hypothetical protein [Vibrio coralliirubri]
MMLVKKRFASLLAFLPLVLVVPTAIAGGTINNYLDGFTYEKAAIDAKERIVAVKDLSATELGAYSVSLELIESSGNEFAAIVNDQVIDSDVGKQAVLQMLSATLHGKGDDSALRIDYDLSKHELISLYGENSLLAVAMTRCNLSAVKLRIEIEGDEFRFISPLQSQELTVDTLHQLSFCD